ncbi:MAG: peptidoglycan DD-metalloendopeptidase family protein [Rhodospirillales bacterium]|nr:peptidoglycan DD-metalloendopeptidase family protein [Rhodospirillales bacterium]MCW8862726.1 peptidoglycan DD-metalloendopeptidase family protein [Rhodospirillales bacterium]MCW8951745.1 peptidoglycan DD-metalloendopeptidase family protein [Rhodospirillales bacterium]MCW9003420.1 peptidoglycan DD-metalloendopeptidase family protein [Rhodospirillales bacterium]MCW9039605.1 peptidoglycan DD-metalloendopeptidase family protein [Rhodospirillales bacterium]
MKSGHSAKQKFSDRLVSLSNRLFPERQVLVRTEGRVYYRPVSNRVQVAIAFAAFMAMVWTTFATVSFFSFDRIIAAKDDAFADARLAYNSLLSDVGAYQKRFNVLADELQENHSMMLRLVEQNATLQHSLKTVENELETTEVNRKTILSARETLKRRLFEIEGEMREMAGRNFALQDNLESIEMNLQAVKQQRDEALADSHERASKVVELEESIAELEMTEKSVLQRLTELTDSRIEGLEAMLARTGINLETHLAKVAPQSNQGGPFIAAGKATDADSADDEDRPETRMRAALTSLDESIGRLYGLQKLMAQVPLLAPLDYYYISSPFGKRRDPVNKKWAMHYGLDMGSSAKAPVHATAPGTVTFAGWKGNYGKVVEVDHGAGIKTRYGHLHKIMVKKGDKIGTRQVVGQVGNTGRTTGPHLHYEIVVNGKAVSPIKFIKAGKYVFKS